MNFQYQNQTWPVIRATEKPYVKTTDCCLPRTSAEKLAKWLLATEPTIIELLGMRAYRDHAGRQHHVWGFRIDSRLVEIAHQPDMSVRNKMK